MNVITATANPLEVSKFSWPNSSDVSLSIRTVNGWATYNVYPDKVVQVITRANTVSGYRYKTIRAKRDLARINELLDQATERVL